MMLRMMVFSGLGLLALVGCQVTESHRVLEPQKVSVPQSAYSGPRVSLVVANFQNRSSYNRGLFSDGGDRLGSQAKTILKTHLQMTNRFTVVDRDNLTHIARESDLSGQSQQLTGAKVALTGDVTEFGRKEVGDQQLFGILGSGRKQIAYAKVALNVVDVLTSEIIYSVQGAGEYELKNREVVGFGTTAGYDATLNGKVLNLALTQAVEALVEGLDQNAWSAK